MEKQIKSKSRVSDFGEVYTAKKQVADMLDLIDQPASDIFATVLEPACGNGNFLSEILTRKLGPIMKAPLSGTRIEHDILRAVSSIYGVDIQKDNVIECRERLYGQVIKAQSAWSPLFHKALRDILSRNIMCGDTLSMMTPKGDPLTITEWEIKENGTMIRKDVLFCEMVSGGGESSNYIRRRYYRWLAEDISMTA